MHEQHLRVTTDDGVRLHVVDEHLGGAPRGPAVVLVGGYGMGSAGWTLQRRHLVERGHRVVTVDRRSHGRSDRPKTGHTLERHGRDLEAVAAHLGLEAVHLVGSSMGASTIWAYLATFGEGRVRSVTSIDQTPRMVNDDGWRLGLYGLTAGGVDGFVAGFPDTAPGRGFRHPVPPAEVLAAIAGDDEPFSFDGTRELLRDHTVADWRATIEATRVPVLAIGGARSPLWPAAASRWIAEAAPLGTYVELDTGHVPFVERPDEFDAALDAFLEGAT